MNVDKARTQMVEQQVRAWNVLDSAVLEVMADVPREMFVPERYRRLAFADTAIPLPCGQQMMTPTVEGRMLQALQVTAGDRVLEIGTGSGYIAACLAALGGNVTTLELHPELADSAASKLQGFGAGAVRVETTDGSTLSADREYDVIAVTGGIPSRIAAFEKALKPGGRLFAIIGHGPVMTATLVTRGTTDAWAVEGLFETGIPLLENVAVPQPFEF